MPATASRLAIATLLVISTTADVRAAENTASAMSPGVLRAYVWQCDGGLRVHMRNLLREDAIVVEFDGQAHRLPHVISASGARYSDGSLTFWTKGDTALLERAAQPLLHCRELRAESLRADARERGVVFLGYGNEPGWSLEIGADGRLRFVTDYGAEQHEFARSAVRGGETDGVTVFSAGPDGARLEVSVSRQDCADDMSGEPFEYRMTVEYGGRTLHGCARALR